MKRDEERAECEIVTNLFFVVLKNRDCVTVGGL